jgi:hypothetical protein
LIGTPSQRGSKRTFAKQNAPIEKSARFFLAGARIVPNPQRLTDADPLRVETTRAPRARLKDIGGLDSVLIWPAKKFLLSRAATGIFRSCRKTKTRQQGKVPFCSGRLLRA